MSDTAANPLARRTIVGSLVAKAEATPGYLEQLQRISPGSTIRGQVTGDILAEAIAYFLEQGDPPEVIKGRLGAMVDEVAVLRRSRN